MNSHLLALWLSLAWLSASAVGQNAPASAPKLPVANSPGHLKLGMVNLKCLTSDGPDAESNKVGIAVCADGSDRKNLQALVDNGAQLIYGPHANTTGGSIAGWYRFRSAWGGAEGWIAQAKVYAALHNHAGLYHPDFNPPAANDANTGWASGAWVIGPDGTTLAQMPTSTQRDDSKEFVLIYDIPIPAK